MLYQDYRLFFIERMMKMVKELHRELHILFRLKMKICLNHEKIL